MTSEGAVLSWSWFTLQRFTRLLAGWKISLRIGKISRARFWRSLDFAYKQKCQDAACILIWDIKPGFRYVLHCFWEVSGWGDCSTWTFMANRSDGSWQNSQPISWAKHGKTSSWYVLCGTGNTVFDSSESVLRSQLVKISNWNCAGPWVLDNHNDIITWVPTCYFLVMHVMQWRFHT